MFQSGSIAAKTACTEPRLSNGAIIVKTGVKERYSLCQRVSEIAVREAVSGSARIRKGKTHRRKRISLQQNRLR